jgi:hypothetical protein
MLIKSHLKFIENSAIARLACSNERPQRKKLQHHLKSGARFKCLNYRKNVPDHCF